MRIFTARWQRLFVTLLGDDQITSSRSVDRDDQSSVQMRNINIAVTTETHDSGVPAAKSMPDRTRAAMVRTVLRKRR